jgi:hypothetical protein
MMKWKRWWPDLPEGLPVDVLPASNGEFVPPPPTREQQLVMRLANNETERWRRKFNMSRREFVRTAAAMSIGFWAIDRVMGGRFGSFGSPARAADDQSIRACDLDNPNAQMDNLPGEFIFDIQSHHVESDGLWRVTNPSFEAFFAAIWAQSGPVTGPPPGMNQYGVHGSGYGGEIDPIESLSRFHYLKELFLDSSTTMTVLSAVPAAPDSTQPLPIDRAALTVETVNSLAKSQRTVMHAFVMPNRGSGGFTTTSLGQKPIYMQNEFDTMEERAIQYRDILVAWKTYPAWGDIPYASGWFFDDPVVGQAFVDQVKFIGDKYAVPKVIATHKGFALPGFDQRAASPRDIGPAARANPDVNFVVYHSGYDSETQTAYPGDDNVNAADRGVDSLIKSLRESGWDASRFPDGNVPNVFAEIGSTWRSVMSHPDQAAHLLGKLITYVGPKQICWGTDSLWFGSPQSEIVGLRQFEFTAEGKEFYNLPFGLEGDVENPQQAAPSPDRTIRNGIFGRNAARVYRVDPDATRHAMSCDDVQKLRDQYLVNQMTPRESVPMASNTIVGPRTRRELFTQRAKQPWGP